MKCALVSADDDGDYVRLAGDEREQHISDREERIAIDSRTFFKAKVNFEFKVRSHTNSSEESERKIARDITDEFLIKGINISFCWFTSLASRRTYRSPHTFLIHLSTCFLFFDPHIFSRLPLVDTVRCCREYCFPIPQLPPSPSSSSPCASRRVIEIVLHSIWCLLGRILCKNHYHTTTA